MSVDISVESRPLLGRDVCRSIEFLVRFSITLKKGKNTEILNVLFCFVLFCFSKTQQLRFFPDRDAREKEPFSCLYSSI